MSASPVSREALHARFGNAAFAPGCFYANAPALRFELSLGGHRLDEFAQAWDRGREIVDVVFRDAPRLVVVLAWIGDAGWGGTRALIQALRELGVRPGRPRATWAEPFQADWTEGPETRSFLAFACDREVLHRLLWGALARDLGVRPRLDASLYVADPERGVLIHPYDDRGMDVIGPNHARLAELYHRFSDRLLDHDRARMDGFFASAF